MHEMALMAGIVKTIKESAAEHNLKKINKIKLVIGKLTMVYPEALQFAFSACRQDPIFSSTATLEIEERPITAHCRGCQCEFSSTDNFSIICPQCDTLAVDLITGREFFVDYIEGD